MQFIMYNWYNLLTLQTRYLSCIKLNMNQDNLHFMHESNYFKILNTSSRLWYAMQNTSTLEVLAHYCPLLAIMEI